MLTAWMKSIGVNEALPQAVILSRGAAEQPPRRRPAPLSPWKLQGV